MKKKPNHFNLHNWGLPFLLMIAMLITKPTTTHAQKDTTDKKLLKYELSIDLVPIIDNGTFGKIYFKINHFKDRKLKGAFRIGASEGYYSWLKILPNNGSNPSFNTKYDYEFQLFVGYEKQKRIASVSTYYGVDILGLFNKNKYDTYAQGGNFSNTQFGICPFVGLRQPIYKNISAAFELGWVGWIGYSKSFQETGEYMDSWSIFSSFNLPYNFTLNYNF